ncbi:MAG: cell division protein FtsI (penicillin-binding protein 3) [Verrucomicrobia bacterium]|nr:MAG: cell division protein FtsI (penicillin-binding protein 3) [Verrucomicrobiota bacterium]
MSKGFASSYRIVLLAVVILVCFAGLGARLVFLHVIDRDVLVRFIDKARRQIIVESARRGDVLDAKGGILATSRTLIVLGVDPQSLRKEDETKWPQLAELIGLPLADLTKTLLTKSRPAVPTNASTASSPAKPGDLVINFALHPESAERTPIAKTAVMVTAATDTASDDTVLDDNADENGLRPIRWAKLSETVEESTYAKIQALGIKGVYGQRAYRRAYPHNSLAAHVIGYLNKQGEPAAGIERYADFYLHGRDGWREGERDGLRRELAQFRTRDVPASDGFTVRLSIDSAIQHMAEEELDALAKKYSPQKATIIISDPQTGFILALANYPTFNLNEYNLVPAVEQGAMRNVAVSDMYEPGSVFKIVAASGALNEGLVTSASRFDCSIDKIDYKGRTRGLPGEDHHFDEPLSVAEIISHSSNRGAAQLAMKLGDDRFYAYARAFGFGQLSGFPVGGEIVGSMASPAKWDGLTITRMPMGQSIAATPMQMHMAMGVIASGGYLLRPQIISQINDSSGEPVYRYLGVAKSRVITQETARTMARLLTGVVSDRKTRYGNEGTAPEAAIPNYEVAGKTGTSQKYMPEVMANGTTRLLPSKKHHVASFVGFFPASHPQVAISVIVDDADAHAPGGVAYGAKVAAPSFKHLGEQLIQYLDLKPAYDTSGRTALAMEGGRR